MAEPSIPVFEIEKMIEKIMVASFEKLIRSDRGKEKVVIEDDKEAKDEIEEKEHVDDTWQDYELFKKINVSPPKNLYMVESAKTPEEVMAEFEEEEVEREREREMLLEL
ncbi:hypothetical protein JCGZ_05327 [Jatropha curcas]|uniref:Uncharacterized protein n=1 Tax=Jatropha curcas TaxID=180498 RepID=A0A067KTG8_JATCU|nr:hypothetical protein JCGZ_05327 [Jatropha curcas]